MIADDLSGEWVSLLSIHILMQLCDVIVIKQCGKSHVKSSFFSALAVGLKKK